MRNLFLVSACAAALLAVPAKAQTAPDETADSAFGLGQIIVTGSRPQGERIDLGGATLGQVAIETFQRNSLDEAANLIPGVVVGNSGGSRNERLLFVRGFDRFQVPLSIDGIRVYLPADNRLDYGRFLTPDIAEIQVAKGYASVLDGPGAMGGAVNLVTRKPTKELEIEARGTLNLDRDANYGGYTVFGLVGTKHDKWYAQASYARNFTDHWDLPGSFTPTVNENGGARDFSRTEDWRANAKIGFTPNATDEYAISYTRQEGSKNAPLHITETSAQVLRIWTWPEWNIDSVYWLSSTAIGDKATFKTKAYYNEFYNMLKSFNDRTQTAQTISPRTFDSPYNDSAYGGSAEMDVAFTPQETLSVAFHYRHDEHKERQTTAPGSASPVVEPLQVTAERTWSIAAENRYAFTDAVKLTLGASFDWRDTDRAQEYTAARGVFSYPLRNTDGWNAQGRLDWAVDEGSNVHASVSSRVRFPTIFERFSSQFNSADPNPDLKPERATNFEIGGDRSFGPVHATAAIFYNHIDDALVTVRTAANLNRRVNIGSADYYGGEITLDAELRPNLQAGITYSYIHRDFSVGTAPTGGFIRLFRLTDVPDHKGFAYVSWRPIKPVQVVPSVEFASSRTTVTAATANADAPVYYDTGSYVTAALRIDYDVTENVTVGIGAKNLFDRYYILTDGFPEPGRSFYLTARARF